MRKARKRCKGIEKHGAFKGIKYSQSHILLKLSALQIEHEWLHLVTLLQTNYGDEGVEILFQEW